ncbi:alpha/beta hydrolase family protein [Pseudactinotalea sp. Z1739]|uniref:alpha/beta hydrolase family protein n=1 Tax=Pseudactinotalea sp. Z1739 TaxID=3413028 RepID=UPI003C7B8062
MNQSTRLINDLLSIRTWTAFDIDGEGRVLAGHDELGSMQLVEIGTDGSRTALTDLPGRCTGRYMPGKRAVVVQHDAGGDENWQLSALDLETTPATPARLEDLRPLVRHERYMHVLQDVTEAGLVYSTNRRNGVDMDVVVRSHDDGTEQVAYDGGGYVVAVRASHDGTSAAVVRLSLQPASTVVETVGPHAFGAAGPADASSGTFGATDTAGTGGAAEKAGTSRTVTDPGEHASHRQVHWGAEDDGLILSSNHGREFHALWRVDEDGWRLLVGDEAADLDCWVSPDATRMVVGRQRDGVIALSLYRTDGTHERDLDIPGLGSASVTWSTDSANVVISGSTPTEPGAIHRVRAVSGQVDLIASSAAELDEGLRDRLITPSVHRVPTPDGEQVPCFVYAGATVTDDAATGQNQARSALSGASVIHIHGGPEASADLIFAPVIQALAATGLTVLVPNVRGSAGYGKRWISLDDVELRLDSVADLAALHAWLPDLGLDPGRSALWGGSYGGYMVLAGLSMQPQLWAAGVDIVGMSSLVTFLENTSDYRRAYREREYGTLEQHRAFLEKASPITYLDQIRAPLFIIHGANDPRVPLSEAEQIQEALEASGVPNDLRVYRDEGHGLSKRSNRLDAYPAALDFLRTHLAVPQR